MKKNSKVIHQIAYCSTCGKTNENYIKQAARKWAYQHAKNTGHKVSVETGTAIHYNQ